METSNAVSLDFLLEPVQPAGKVTLLGVEYELMRADLMEEFLTLMAMTEKAASVSKINAVGLPEEMEKIRTELRRMILILLPAFPERILHEELGKMDQLLKLFTLLIAKAHEGLPETLKKNCNPEQTLRQEMDNTKT